MATQYIAAGSIRNGDDLLLAMFGQPGDKTFKDVAERDQREVLGDDVQSNEYRLPESMDLLLNGKRIEEYKGDKSKPIRLKMKFASKALYAADRISQDLVKPAYWIYGQLVQKSPTLFGRYRKSHEFTIDGEAVGKALFLPKDAGVFFVGVTNLIDYASTLENPKWPRTYQRVFRAAQRKYGAQYDIRLSYINGEFLGGTITTSGKPKRYHQPILEIAPLGTMGRTGFVFKKRQRASIRRKRRT